jgi:PrtD family type I secretion system ABC transporter
MFKKNQYMEHSSTQPTRQPAQQSKRSVQDILDQCRRALGVAFGLTFLIDLLGLTPMLYMMSAYDRVLTSRSGVTLVSLTLVVLGFYVFWSALEWIRARLMVRLSLRIDWELAADVFDASFRRYVDRRNVNVHQVLGDLVALRQFMTGAPVLALMDAPFALVFILVAGIFHPYLALFAAAASVLMVLLSVITLRWTSPLLKQANNANAEASRVAANGLKQADAALALGMMRAVRNRWYAQHRQFLTHQVNASEASGLLGGVSGFLQKALPSLQLGLAVYLAMEGLITGGMVIVASMLIGKAVAPVQKLIASWKDIVAARQAYDRLSELMMQDASHSVQRMSLPPPKGQLTVTAATAVPPGSDKPVLMDIQFSLEPGQVMAIVGPSAAGKTSLVKLLLGIWRPARGSVRLDGVELSDWNHDDVGPQMGYVPQDIDFHEGTVADNIARLGTVNAEDVVAASQTIQMHETILKFPKGYDTPMGESGYTPSGGQRQRLAIARALYGMPRYVVMDEPNSNLDEAGEQSLMEAIRVLKESGSTVILTTHRPRLIGMVDRMLVLREGRQVAFGDAQEIMQALRKLQGVAPEERTAESVQPHSQGGRS